MTAKMAPSFEPCRGNGPLACPGNAPSGSPASVNRIPFWIVLFCPVHSSQNKRKGRDFSRFAMKRVGLIGWRGMVGSVLMDRMKAERDFAVIEPTFFSTSQVGVPGPDVGKPAPPVKDAKSIADLKAMDILISCQGGDYTTEIISKLREAGWAGFWIDAASTLRMQKDAVIILDP